MKGGKQKDLSRDCWFYSNHITISLSFVLPTYKVSCAILNMCSHTLACCGCHTVSSYETHSQSSFASFALYCHMHPMTSTEIEHS